MTAATGSEAAVMGRSVISASTVVAVWRKRRSAQMPVPIAVAPKLNTHSRFANVFMASKSVARKLAQACIS